MRLSDLIWWPIVLGVAWFAFVYLWKPVSDAVWEWRVFRDVRRWRGDV